MVRFISFHHLMISTTFFLPAKSSPEKKKKQLAEYLLTQCGISRLPASLFGLPESDLSLRLCTQDFDGSCALNAVCHSEALNESFILKYMPNIVNGLNRLQDVLQQLLLPEHL